jgi:hypothetical protein
MQYTLNETALTALRDATETTVRERMAGMPESTIDAAIDAVVNATVIAANDERNAAYDGLLQTLNAGKHPSKSQRETFNGSSVHLMLTFDGANITFAPVPTAKREITGVGRGKTYRPVVNGQTVKWNAYFANAMKSAGYDAATIADDLNNESANRAYRARYDGAKFDAAKPLPLPDACIAPDGSKSFTRDPKWTGVDALPESV